MTDLHIAGYASRFGETDLSGDQVRRGAFSAALLSRLELYPMLFGHQTDQPIGVWDRIFEDDIGLFVAGRVLDGGDLAASTARLIMERAVGGLSIGYRARRSTPRPSGGRILTDIDLWEVSVVAFPMLRSARITHIGDTPELNATHHRRFA